MSLNAVAHLNFHGDARAALNFHQSVSGGQLTIATCDDFGMPAHLPGATNVVFGQIVAGNGFRVMAYDVPGAVAPAARGAITTRRENGATGARSALVRPLPSRCAVPDGEEREPACRPSR